MSLLFHTDLAPSNCRKVATLSLALDSSDPRVLGCLLDIIGSVQIGSVHFGFSCRYYVRIGFSGKI